jgi:hypothetical protein
MDDPFAEARRQYEKYLESVSHLRMDEQTLLSLPDEEVEQALCDLVLARIGFDYDREVEILTGLPPGVQAVYTTTQLENEVCNGGFNQYFWNSSGRFAPLALSGLKLIGAKSHAILLDQAIALQAMEESSMRKYREADTLESFAESYEHTGLNALDDEFYELEDLSPYRVRFIRQHPDLCVETQGDSSR